MSTPFYSKLDKSIADLIKGEDFEPKNSASIKTAGAGVVFTSSLENAKGAFVGTLKAETKCKGYGDFTVETNTSDLLKITWKTLEFYKGLKAEVKGSHKRVNGKSNCELSAENQYVPKANAAVTAGLTVTNEDKDNKTASVSAVVSQNGLVAGFEAKHNLSVVKSYGVAVGVNTNGTSLLAKTKGIKSVDVSVYSTAWKTANVGATFNFDFKKILQSVPDFTVGASKGSIRAVYKSEGVFSGLYGLQLNKNAKLSIAANVNTKNVCSYDHSVGFKLEIGDL